MNRNPSKFRNKKTVVDGITFDSQKEARRYEELKILLRSGMISDLKLQPEFTISEGYRALDGKKVSAARYIADFSYIQDGQRVVEDVKGAKTPVYKLKARVLADMGITITEVTR